MKDIYEKWLSCGEDWHASTWVVSLSSTTVENKRGARRWMTKSQLEAKYQSASIASEIVEMKSKPEFAHQRKLHPDLPHRLEPKLIDFALSSFGFLSVEFQWCIAI